MLDTLETKRVIYDTHHDGIVPELFEKFVGLQQYKLLATALDRKGKEYAAAYEHRRFPIFCVQYHPEKASYVWIDELNIPRCSEAIDLATHYSKLFVTEAKRNSNKFRSRREAQANLITNLPILSTETTAHDVYILKSIKNGIHH